MREFQILTMKKWLKQKIIEVKIYLRVGVLKGKKQLLLAKKSVILG